MAELGMKSALEMSNDERTNGTPEWGAVVTEMWTSDKPFKGIVTEGSEDIREAVGVFLSHRDHEGVMFCTSQLLRSSDGAEIKRHCDAQQLKTDNLITPFLEAYLGFQLVATLLNVDCDKDGQDD